MKEAYSIILMLCFSLVCKAQSNFQNLSDSLGMKSRAKADMVLKYFDTLKTTKILFSIEDRYFYVIMKDTPCYKEYYVALDSLGDVENLHPVKVEKKNRKQRRQEKQYCELMLKAEPVFDLGKYHTDFITMMPNAKKLLGRPSYFVVIDTHGKRYGEYSLLSLTAPLPINTNLWAYLISKLSEEIANSLNE